jgi:hypothetical protein
MSPVLFASLGVCVVTVDHEAQRLAKQGQLGFSDLGDESRCDPDDSVCIECGEPIGADGHWYSDGSGELVPSCATCAARELG